MERVRSTHAARWIRTAFVVAGLLVGFLIREVGDDADGDVSTGTNVLAFGVVVAFILVGAIAEYVINRRTRST